MVFVPEVITAWLFGHEPYLEDVRPIDVLHIRGIANLLDALDSVEQTARGG
jgi:hypothetical protein